MRVGDIRKIAKQRKILPLPKRKKELIQAIQSHEGYSSCYASQFSSNCGQDVCLWRPDCLKEDRLSSY